MSKIIPFVQDAAFGPDALRAMSTALEDVCRMLKVNHDQDAREVMAVRIIELARGGECDPGRLRDRVLREAGVTPSVVDAAEADAVVKQTGSTASMNDQPKEDKPTDAVLCTLGAASIAVLIAYAAVPWWM